MVGSALVVSGSISGSAERKFWGGVRSVFLNFVLSRIKGFAFKIRNRNWLQNYISLGSTNSTVDSNSFATGDSFARAIGFDVFGLVVRPKTLRFGFHKIERQLSNLIERSYRESSQRLGLVSVFSRVVLQVPLVLKCNPCWKITRICHNRLIFETRQENPFRERNDNFLENL